MLHRKCLVCEKSIWIKRFHALKGWGKYCSKKCQAKKQENGEWIQCSRCGKSIYRTPKDFKRSKSKKFFCSKACHCSWENENTRCGSNAPNWIAGEQSYKKILIKAGISRRCRKCDMKDYRVLVVHHKDRNRKNNQIENLEWLCMNCHHLEHLTIRHMAAMV
ncbi:MAG: HNH endonuclease [Candidatus Omnitrophica bacterium]|nr:HNH endonuclease [Candidatus Omnitrophota bacterium]